MICPFCSEEGNVSTLTEGPVTSTLMMSYPHHDEEGRRHFHDWNTHERHFKCSMGHAFSTFGKDPCPEPSCTWPDREGAVVRLSKP